MKIKSLMRQHHKLVPVDIELSLSPGLPQIVVLGLPDAMIRESVLRIKSALKHQGFEWPRARQILVHLKPSHIKKTSLGLDLAIAAALLWETRQLIKPAGPLIVYGELSLKGEVLTPPDVARASTLITSETVFITGEAAGLMFATRQLKELKHLAAPQIVQPQTTMPTWERPINFYQDFSRVQADLIRLIAAGEHNALIAGPPGCGKTSVAEEIAPFLDEPAPEMWAEQMMWAQQFQQPLTWRPVVQSHHSTPPLSLLGGGATLRPGEITRAHGGLLIMDEMLEYSPRVQEALREPVESGAISIARAGSVTKYPADFLLVGTTNLCACGEFDFADESKCRCRPMKREAHIARLNGPFMDRFAIFKIMEQMDDERVSVEKLRADISCAIQFRKIARKQPKPNSKLSLEEILPQLNGAAMPRVGSQRRALAILRVARTLADFAQAPQVTAKNIEQAKKWAQADFVKVQSYKPTSHLRHDPFAVVTFPLSQKTTR